MTEPNDLWHSVLNKARQRMALFTADAWLSPLEASVDGQVLLLVCPTDFHRERVEARFLGMLEELASAEAGRAMRVSLSVRTKRRGIAAARGEARSSWRQIGMVGGSVVENRPSEATRRARGFDDFVVGPCNALAREASLAIAGGPQPHLDLLFLAGAPGTGKSHLVSAIAGVAKHEVSVLHTSAEQFATEFTASIRKRQTESFKRRHRSGCKLLIVEDVQFLEKRKATQMELFHTVRHLVDANERVVMTADRSPSDLTGIDPLLRTQMTAGLVAKLDPPDLPVRREILRSRAKSGGVAIPDDCIDLIARSVDGSVRDLEGILIQLVASASLLRQPIDDELTRAALQKLAPRSDEGKALLLEQVAETVASYFRIPQEDLASRSRRREVLWPRQVAMVLARQFTSASYEEIGRLFDREHTAVRNAVAVVERSILENSHRRQQIEHLSSVLEHHKLERQEPSDRESRRRGGDSRRQMESASPT